MAGLAAGVVSEAQANFPNAPEGKLSASLGNPATWSYIWAAAALLYLVAIYLGMIVIKRRSA